MQVCIHLSDIGGAYKMAEIELFLNIPQDGTTGLKFWRRPVRAWYTWKWTERQSGVTKPDKRLENYAAYTVAIVSTLSGFSVCSGYLWGFLVDLLRHQSFSVVRLVGTALEKRTFCYSEDTHVLHLSPE